MNMGMAMGMVRLFFVYMLRTPAVACAGSLVLLAVAAFLQQQGKTPQQYTAFLFWYFALLLKQHMLDAHSKLLHLCRFHRLLMQPLSNPGACTSTPFQISSKARTIKCWCLRCCVFADYIDCYCCRLMLLPVFILTMGVTPGQPSLALHSQLGGLIFSSAFGSATAESGSNSPPRAFLPLERATCHPSAP